MNKRSTKPTARVRRRLRSVVGRVQSAYLNIQAARRDLDWALRYGFDDQRVDSVRSLSDALVQIQAAISKLTANNKLSVSGERKETDAKH